MISRFIKNNFKIIIAVILTAIICISGTVFATGYFARDVEYTKEGINVKNVEDALNDLYSIKNNKINYIGMYESNEYFLNKNSATLTISDVEKGEYILICFRTLSTVNGSVDVGDIGGELTADRLSITDSRYDIASITGGSYNKISENVYDLIVDLKADITINYSSIGIATNKGGRVRAYVFKK